MLAQILLTAVAATSGISDPSIAVEADTEGMLTAEYVLNYTLPEPEVAVSEPLDHSKFNIQVEEFTFEGESPTVEEIEARRVELEGKFSDVADQLNSLGIEFQVPVFDNEGNWELTPSVTINDYFFAVSLEDKQKVLDSVSGVNNIDPTEVELPEEEILPPCAFAQEEFEAFLGADDIFSLGFIMEGAGERSCELTAVFEGTKSEAEQLALEFSSATGVQLMFAEEGSGGLSLSVSEAPAGTKLSFTAPSGEPTPFTVGESVMVIDPIQEEVVNEVIDTINETDSGSPATSPGETNSTATVLIAAGVAVALLGAGAAAFFLKRKRSVDLTASPED